jgi:hypothetical protein
MRRKAEITLGSGFSTEAAGRKTTKLKGPRNAIRAAEAAAQALRGAKSLSLPHQPLSVVSTEPGKARISFNETVSLATALSILDLLQKDRAGAE